MPATTTQPSPTIHLAPRGPRGLPLVGCLIPFQRDPLAFLTQVAQHGPMSRFRLLHMDIAFTTEPALIEEFLLRTNDRDFAKTPGEGLGRLLFGQGLVASKGELWRRQRRPMQPAFHRARLASYAATMVEFAERRAARWQPGDRLNLQQEMMQVTLEIVVKTLFGAEIGTEAARVEAALSEVMAVFKVLMGSPIALIPTWVPTPLNRRFKEALAELDRIIFEIIQRRRQLDPAHAPDDLLTLLLLAQDEDGSGMSDQQLRDEVMTLFIAGHETTALTLTWAWYLLAQHPEAEATLLAELRTVLGGRAPTLDDLPALRYSEQIIKEAMRLYPPAWIVDARVALHDYELGGYLIPKGQMVAASQWVTHRDPRWFPQPTRFEPERWSDERARDLPKYAYFPFGGGARLCIGNHFAMMEATLLLATIAQRFHLRVAAGQPVTIEPSITLRPRGGIPVTVVAR